MQEIISNFSRKFFPGLIEGYRKWKLDQKRQMRIQLMTP